MTGSTLRERQRQVREDAILDAAHEMMSQHGYEAMSVDELAARVGISKATLYQHFPSKEELVVHVIVRMMRLNEEDIRAENDPATPAIERLKRALQCSLTRKMKLSNATLTMPPLNVTRHPHYQAVYERLTETATQLVDKAKAAGDINPALSTPALVHMALWLFRADYSDLLVTGKCSPDEVINTLVTVLMNGSKPAH